MTTSSVLEASPALPRGLSFGPGGARLYLEPVGLLSGHAAVAAIAGDRAMRLAGGPLAFPACAVLLRDGRHVRETVAPVGAILEWTNGEAQTVSRRVQAVLDSLGKMRPAFAGLPTDRPAVMGIVNVTPDSFSDGGRYFDEPAAIAHGLRLLEAGADLLDIGGESTRPGAAPVDADEENRRVLPVIRALAERGAIVSVDTRHAAVMAAAAEQGAAIINDVTALLGDPQSLAVAAKSRAAVVLMHTQGDPQVMQQDPRYAFAPLDVYDHLAERLDACRAAGIPDERLCVDPGIGFGKTVEHNLQLMARLGLFHGLGVPVLLGVSRKSFIGKVSRGEPAADRLGGSLAAALQGLGQGVQIVRVHDVAETVQALAVWRGMTAA